MIKFWDAVRRYQRQWFADRLDQADAADALVTSEEQEWVREARFRLLTEEDQRRFNDINERWGNATALRQQCETETLKKLQAMLRAGELHAYVQVGPEEPRLLPATFWFDDDAEEAFRRGTITIAERARLVFLEDIGERSEGEPAPLRSAARRERSRPNRSLAKRLLDELFPNGIPDQADLPNQKLLTKIQKHPEGRHLQLDSILRAAGRRKT